MNRRALSLAVAATGYFEAQKITLIPQTQYFDKFVLTRVGVTKDTNHAVKDKLGFADDQRFSGALLDAAAHVASTSVGDDCGEGFAAPNPWEKLFAAFERRPASRRATP